MGKDTQLSVLGSKIEVTEVEDLNKGTLIVGDGTGAPAKLTVGTNGQVLTADSAQTTGTKWAGAGGTELLSAGTFTIQTTTTAYGTDHATIAITAGDLTAKDVVIIEFGADIVGNKAVGFAIGIDSATANADGLADVGTPVGSTVPCIGTFTIMQDPNNSDIILITQHMIHSNTSVVDKIAKHDSNDADVFTTAFNIELQAKLSATGNSSTVDIRFVAYIQKGQ